MKSAEFFFPERHIVSTHRPVQLQMAHTVETALNVGGIALIEAKTGTGKSMGYSIPAAVYLNDFYKTKPKQVRKMSGLLTPEGQDVYHTPRIIISTAKKSLQTQLMQKDLPHITKHIEAVSYAVLKGKNNYICKVRHNDFIDPSRIIRNQREYNYRDIEQYTTWASQTTTGDLTEINYPFLFRVGVTECLKKACTFKNNCYYLDQKDTFKNAAIGITNHSFLAYEVLLGRTRLFGIYDQLIIDEAHSLVQAVREAFSTTITNKFPSQLKRNFSVMLGDHSVDELEGHFIRLFNYLSLQPEGELSINRNLYDLVLPTIESILELKQSAQKIIKPFLSSDANIDNPWEVDFSGFSELAIAEANAILSMAYGLKLIDKALSALRRGIGINPEETLIKELLDQNKITQEAADKYLENRANMNYAVHLRTNNAFQGSEKQIEFRTDPVEVGPMLGPFLKNMHSVVITSATLANDGDFEYSLRQLGLTSADVPYQQALPHVFDYARQSMIYINDTMPPPDFYRGSVFSDDI
jgi:ATP-dependent DNA helicase DinG